MNRFDGKTVVVTGAVVSVGGGQTTCIPSF